MEAYKFIKTINGVLAPQFYLYRVETFYGTRFLTKDFCSFNGGAKCLYDKDHWAPMPNCTCGFHSYSIEGLSKLYFSTGYHSRNFCSTLYRVSLYGKIQVHEFGYRSEFLKFEEEVNKYELLL